jgi:hypothetical protein
MPWLYFWILTAMLAVTLAVTLFKPEKIYEYPYFMAAAFVVFIVPQAISLIHFPGGAQSEWIANALLMCCLCFGACWAGYFRPPVQSWQQRMSQSVNLDRMFHGGVVFIVISFFFDFLISMMTEEEIGGNLWTGKVTIYGFFAGLIYPGFAICLMTALRTGRLMAWLATVVAAIQPVEISVLSGRREDTVLFLLTLALTLYYQRGIKPSRAAIILLVTFAMLAIPATGTYRGLAAQRDWQGVKQIKLMDNFKDYLNQESILELRNATFLIEATRQSGSYQYGEGYWDQLVWRFVPAQLLGKGFKDSLMFHSPYDQTQNELSKLGYEASVGSTITGMGDSFQQLGWFGCLFFAAMALLFKTLFNASVQPNAVFAQVFYIQIATSAMRAVTHQTLDFLPGLVYYIIFLGLLFLYARVPLRQTSPDADIPTPQIETRKNNRKKRGLQSIQETAPFSVTSPKKTEIQKPEN